MKEHYLLATKDSRVWRYSAGEDPEVFADAKAAVGSVLTGPPPYIKTVSSPEQDALILELCRRLPGRAEWGFPRLWLCTPFMLEESDDSQPEQALQKLRYFSLPASVGGYRRCLNADYITARLSHDFDEFGSLGARMLSGDPQAEDRLSQFHNMTLSLLKQHPISIVMEHLFTDSIWQAPPSAISVNFVALLVAIRDPRFFIDPLYPDRSRRLWGRMCLSRGNMQKLLNRFAPDDIVSTMRSAAMVDLSRSEFMALITLHCWSGVIRDGQCLTRDEPELRFWDSDQAITDERYVTRQSRRFLNLVRWAWQASTARSQPEMHSAVGVTSNAAQQQDLERCLQRYLRRAN